MNKESSRAYIVSHMILRSEIYSKWPEFSNHLQQGPEHMKEYLSELWHGVNSNNEDFVLTDLDREITKDNFNVTANIVNNMHIFYFTFPEPDILMAQAKCVALVLAPTMPRYFTMEIADILDEKKKYMIGEWAIVENNFVHKNYGYMEKDTVDAFAYCVEDIIKSGK